MHYYTRNLGDYAKKAGRLSMLQHGAYTLLLDACYDRERFPTESEAIEWTWASTPEEEQAVKFVLSRFFEIQEDGTYVQSRVKEELAMFKVGGIQNRLIAISREARKQKRDDLAKACDQLRDEIKHAPLSKTHEAWTSVIDALIKTHEAPPNQEPITNNQEPRTNNQKEKPHTTLEQEFQLIWDAYPKREGSNPKNKAFSCFKARIAEGCMVENMAAGVARYVLYCTQKGMIGTEYVMQATRFFGPGKEFENDWEVSNASNHSNNPQHGLHAATGSPKLSTVGRNSLKAREFLAGLEAEDSGPPGDHGAIVATAG